MSVDELLEALLPALCVDFPCLDTPYSKYSNTNYSAFGQDMHAIHEIIQQRQTQLDNVTTELTTIASIMHRIRSVHEQLLDKRDQIVTSIKAHQGLVSCIRRLPSEILGEIFVRCLPPVTHIEPDTRTAPLLLTGVCRGWRRVALGTPRLWCSLSVRPSDGRLGVQQPRLFFYHHWLSRARGYPLSLAVDTRRPPDNPVWRYEVTELLQPYTGRSVRLRVTFDDPTAPDMLLKDVPLLEHLTLEGDLCATQKITIVQSAPEPRLRSLTLDAITLSADALTAFDPGWTHLTRLHVTLGRVANRAPDAPQEPIVLRLLALCPHLEEFIFSPVSISRQDVSRAITHTRLRSLEVVVLYGVGCLLDALTLPMLRHIKIRDMDIIPSVWRHEELKSFVERSKCPLETLRIHGAQVPMKKEDRAAYAAMIPTLKQLDVCVAVMMQG